MSRHEPKRLSAEDRILWNRVARSTVPLPHQKLDSDPEPVEIGALGEFVPTARPPHPVKQPADGHKPARRPAPLDATDRRKLSRGRLPIEARIDLHGMNQGEAHTLLLSFLHRAHSRGLRHVLVVTGKGTSRGSEGVLRRAVPGWLATPPFSAIVSAHADAARQHGGEGAIYVRLRRRDRGYG